jgi:mono/diheme cytochrome c family protein
MAKLPPHFFVYGALAIGLLGAGVVTVKNSMVYPFQLWFTDMMDAEFVRAYEAPMRATPEGSVSRNMYRDHVEPYGQSVTRMNAEITDALTNPLKPTPEVMAEGEWVYGVYCAPCHGANGEGNGPVTQNEPDKGKKRFQMPGLPLVGDAGMLQHRNDGYVFLTVRNGGAIMPSYGLQLNDEEVWSLVHFLRKMDKK